MSITLDLLSSSKPLSIKSIKDILIFKLKNIYT
jgi:hypothetical protein